MPHLDDPAARTGLGVLSTATLPAAVTARLAEFFTTRAPLLAPMGEPVTEVASALADFVLGGGKRIRPVFAWWGWRAGGGDPAGPEAAAVLTAASALELIQACALIHDDIIDASGTRRGTPTVHVNFAARHRERGFAGDSNRFGTAVAILAGDLALSWADDLFAAAPLSAPARAAAGEHWAAMRTVVLGGQLLDLYGEAGGDESLAGAEMVGRFKTAAYTVERPLLIGAGIASADPALSRALGDFGADIGIAFQLRDDLLGALGDPAVTGKPAGDDLQAGKHTALIAMALAAADARDPAAARDFRAHLGTPLEPEAIARLQGRLRNLGAVEAVEARITELTSRALRRLTEVPMPPEAADALTELAMAATARTS